MCTYAEVESKCMIPDVNEYYGMNNICTAMNVKLRHLHFYATSYLVSLYLHADLILFFTLRTLDLTLTVTIQKSILYKSIDQTIMDILV